MDDWLLLTGATGFIGHYVLAELLGRRRRCAVLLRNPPRQSRRRLARLLAELGVDLDAQIAAERVILVAGDIRDGFEWPEVRIGQVVHVAAATRFTADADGEPWKTNVRGTANLLRLGESGGVESFHLVSSAYSCGRTTGLVDEEFVNQSEFHNDYEQSKHAAEGLCVSWRDQSPRRRRLTIYRPSIVVGEFHSGRSTRFNGFYISARATELLSRSLSSDAADRHRVQLRISGRADQRQNIVPVDYVAAAIAAVVDRPECHGGIYHLTHPTPPSNQRIKQAMERYFDLSGGYFVEPEEFARQQLNDRERAFYEVSRPIQHYFIDTPEFARGNAQRLERELNVSPPAEYDDPAIARLLCYAQRSGWGRRRVDDASASLPLCAAYFENFLPRHVGRSRIARMSGLSATVRFVIEDEDNGQWLCRFEDGHLAQVSRGEASDIEDFAYRSDRVSFWKAISGRIHPQELFLSGRADITGNIEQALKMAVALHAFTQEFPCDFDSLMEQRRQEKSCQVT